MAAPLQLRRLLSSGASPQAQTHGPTESQTAQSGQQSAQYHTRQADEQHYAIDRILRVDHAGEYGALRIYDGQLAVLRSAPTTPVIQEMRAQEQKHLRNLQTLMPVRRVRPTALLPLWNAAGFALGAASALAGERAAMAVTVAVEDVICQHYNDQLRTLSELKFQHEHDLRALIRQHRDDEEQHKETGLRHDAQQAPLYNALSAVVKAGCRAAIWISERV